MANSEFNQRIVHGKHPFLAIDPITTILTVDGKPIGNFSFLYQLDIVFMGIQPISNRKIKSSIYNWLPYNRYFGFSFLFIK